MRYLLALVLSLSSAPLCTAASYSVTRSAAVIFPSGAMAPEPQASLFVPRFDPALGELTDIKVQIGVEINADVLVRPKNSETELPADGIVYLAMQYTVASSFGELISGQEPGMLVIQDNVTLHEGDDSAVGVLGGADTTAYNFPPVPYAIEQQQVEGLWFELRVPYWDLYAFEPSGVVPMDVILSLPENQWTFAVSVTYGYSIPEPASSLLAAFGCILSCDRRRSADVRNAALSGGVD
ncbi:hypothetical protein [Botrimarina mediterranea]|nr:hypothetical protein [Botrimarina mediterranea]